MQRTRLLVALFAALSFSFGAAHATGFTYQGTLQDAGRPADGTYDLELTLYSAADHGTVIGGPLTMLKVPVQHGAFSSKVDFGPLTKTFSQAWLGIKVRRGDSGDFSAMSERLPINVDVVDTATATCPGSWGIGGNAGNPSTSYLGTSDNNPLRFEVDAIQAGQITPGKGVWFSQAGCAGSFCFTPTANGANSFAIGESTNASGNQSFAGGFGATATQTGDFMWGDSQGSANGGIVSTTAADQFIVRSAGGVAINGAPPNSSVEFTVYAGSQDGFGGNADIELLAKGNKGYEITSTVGTSGNDDSVLDFGRISPAGAYNYVMQIAPVGMAINGVPKNSETELSIYPGASTIYNYSSVFMGNKGDTGGILFSVGDESSSTSDDAAFYIDQYDGTTQTRKLVLNSDGLSVNGPNTFAHASSGNLYPSLSVLSGANSQPNTVIVDLLPGTGSYGHFWIRAFADPGDVDHGEMDFERLTPAGSPDFMLELYSISGADHLQIEGDALKPGGGSWTTSSDRRIKQDIAPIQDALDTVMKLRPVNFHYTPEYRAMAGGLADKSYTGFIAQEYAEVFPADVVSTRDHVPGAPDSDPTILALDPNAALINTVAAVQELAINDQASSDRISRFERENAVVKQENATLKAEKDSEVGALQKKLDSVLARLDQLENSSKK